MRNLLQLQVGHNKLLYTLGFMFFFYALFDASFSYMVPIVITQSGYSKTIMGIILGSSSLFGAGFDVFLSKYLKNAHFRRIYLLMFFFCFLAPALLLKNSPLWVFLAAMACWGFYYDLSSFGNMDFVSRKTPFDEHSRSFGILWVFRALGYTLAPLVIGGIIGKTLDFKPYLLLWIFIAIAASFCGLLFYLNKKHSKEYFHSEEKVSLIPEFELWKKLGKLLFPVLILTMFFWIYDAFFWTVGPLMSDVFHSAPQISGLFLTFYTLPVFAVGLFVGRVTKQFGKKRTARVTCLLACIILLAFFFVTNPYAILVVVFLSSLCIAFSVPSLNGAYSDYVSESSNVAKEIEALEDFFTNIGYIIGPILAGFLADTAGNIRSFGYLGIIGIAITVLATVITPKKILIKTN